MISRYSLWATEEQKNEAPVCSHCGNSGFVLAYWIEKTFLLEGRLRLLELDPLLFEKIPIGWYRYCHCNSRLFMTKLYREPKDCYECQRTSWRLTDAALSAGLRWEKIRALPVQEMENLPCEYFERCACDGDMRSFRKDFDPAEEGVLEKIIHALRAIKKLGVVN